MTELSKAYSCGKSDKLHVEAIYSDTEHVIYLPDGWNPGDLRARSALLHELVHHLQYLNKIKATCEAEYEWKAYKLQVEWLREQGVEKPFELLGITPFEVYVLSHCPEF